MASRGTLHLEVVITGRMSRILVCGQCEGPSMRSFVEARDSKVIAADISCRDGTFVSHRAEPGDGLDRGTLISEQLTSVLI